jgi:hypothetical protein
MLAYLLVCCSSHDPKFIILHDGIDTDYFSPDVSVPLAINNLPLTGKETIVTYSTRGMEPYRGFPHRTGDFLSLSNPYQ